MSFLEFKGLTVEELIKKFGFWAFTTAMGLNLFFIKNLVNIIESSSASSTKTQVEIKELRKETTGLLELRIDVGILKSKMEDLRKSIDIRNYNPERR